MNQREYIIGILRQRRSLKPSDASEDDDIRQMCSRRAFEECRGWCLSGVDWSSENKIPAVASLVQKWTTEF